MKNFAVYMMKTVCFEWTWRQRMKQRKKAEKSFAFYLIFPQKRWNGGGVLFKKFSGKTLNLLFALFSRGKGASRKEVSWSILKEVFKVLSGIFIAQRHLSRVLLRQLHSDIYDESYLIYQ